jgi:tetratricopeptide (TPR) repeat protein
MPGEEPAETRNIISGGIQFGPVVQGRDIHASFHLPAAAPVALAQLPAPVTGFTGRDEELAVLAGLLDPARTAGPVVVSAVAGLAGVGKTTLAVEAGHAAQGRGWFGGGVLFIDLHGYDEAPVEPNQALDALLRALGVPAEHIPPTVEERAGLYRSVLAQIGDPVLVIADNASSEAQVKPLLPGTRLHKVLVTSRHSLAGLAARLVDVTVLDEEAGVELLDGALRAARPEDDRITDDPDTAERLAGLCGGLPLALQIAAAVLKADPALSATELADELATESRRLQRLRYEDGSGAAAPSVAAAFELSYRRLADEAARVFRLLSVNPGLDVSTVAAAALTGLPDSQARTVLASLARAHLAEAAPGSGGRWRMHDLLRLYARQLSDAHADTDEREQARDRLLNYYMRVAAAADDHLGALPGSLVPEDFTGQADALAWLDAERPNLVAAVRMAADSGRDEVAIDLAYALAQYFRWRRHFDDLMATATISLKAANRLSNRHDEGGALNNLGNALREVRRFEEAIRAHGDAATIFRETGDQDNEGGALNNLGLDLQEARRFEEAIRAYRDAAPIFRETGDRNGEAGVLNNLGGALKQVRRFREAIGTLQNAAAIYRETGDRHSEGMALSNLGQALQEVQRFEEAVGTLQNAAAIFRETGDRHSEGMALNDFGCALTGIRRFEEAIRAHGDAAAIFRETGDRHSEAQALNNVGTALTGMRRFREAIGTLQNAAAIYRETGDRHIEGQALNNLGLALRGARRFEEAIGTLQNAAAIFRETGDRHSEAQALNNLGLALRDERRFEEAITAHQDAAAIFRETGDRQREGAALNDLQAARAGGGRYRWRRRR